MIKAIIKKNNGNWVGGGEWEIKTERILSVLRKPME